MTQHQKDAALAVALMDLTSLNTSDTTKSIQALVDSINPTLARLLPYVFIATLLMMQK